MVIELTLLKKGDLDWGNLDSSIFDPGKMANHRWPDSERVGVRLRMSGKFAGGLIWMFPKIVVPPNHPF